MAMSSGKPLPATRTRGATSREAVRERAEALGLGWQVLAKKRDWTGVGTALESYARGENDEKLYPSPVRRDGLVVTDAISFDRKLVKTDARKLTVHREDLEDISTLSRLSELKFLDLARTAVNDLRPIAGLTQLEELDLDYTKVENLEPLRRLTRLRRFAASETLVRDISPLADLVALESLWFYDTHVVDVSPLAKLRQLKTLSIGRHVHEGTVSTLPSIKDVSALANLANLELLYINGAELADLEALAGLTKLKKLFLYGCRVPESAVDRLRQVLLGTTFFGP